MGTKMIPISHGPCGYSPATAFVDTLINFLSDSEGLTLEEIKQELRDEGADVDGLIERIQVMVAALKKRRR